MSLFNQDIFECYFLSMIIKADLELVKDASTSKDIESQSKALREPYGRNYFIATDLQTEIVAPESTNAQSLWSSINTGIIGIR